MEEKYQLYPGEKVLKVLMPHIIWYTPFVICFFLGVFSSFLLYFFFPDVKIVFLYSLIWFQIYLVFFYVSLMNYEFHKIIVTNFRVIGFSKQHIFEYMFQEFFYENIAEIKVNKKGILQNTFDYGTIYFYGKQKQKIFGIFLLPEPIINAKFIHDTMNNYFREFYKK